MLYWSILLPYLVYQAYGAPCDTCEDQYPCLDIDYRSISGGSKYEICLKWDGSRSGCNKGDTISHACPSGRESDKIDTWRQGDDYKMCKTVNCEESAQFGVKDGRGCRKSNAFSGLTLGDINGVKCEFTGGYCGGGNNEDCTWSVPAPDCTGEVPETTESEECEYPEPVTYVACIEECGDGVPNCGYGQIEYSNDCMCGCRPQCEVPTDGYFLAYTEECDESLSCSYGYDRYEDDICCGCTKSPTEQPTEAPTKRPTDAPTEEECEYPEAVTYVSGIEGCADYDVPNCGYG
eukprot:554340_1